MLPRWRGSSPNLSISREIVRRAVVLMNLGGPDSLAAVRPFLYNLFSDKAIIGLPAPLRMPLAWLIAARRAAVARGIYSQLGGSSPLLANTEAQAQALETELGAGYRCFVAMRYWHPLTAAAVGAGKAGGGTGTSRGLGRETLLATAAEGARVVAVARNAEAGEAAVEEARTAGGDAVFLQGDVRIEQDVVAAIESDVALSVTVLRLANQVEGRSRGKVESVVKAVELLRERGIEEISLNFAAFAKWMHSPEKASQRALGKLIALGNPFFQIESLYSFNAKFFPRWEPRYLVYEGTFGLPRAGIAAMWAEGQLYKPALRTR